MKNLLLLLALTWTMGSLYGQESESKNLVKFNLLTLAGGKYSLEYERLLNNRISAGVALSFRPEAGLPFKSDILDAIDDEEINRLTSGFKSSNYSITPEVRFYTSNKGAGKGFYLAPFVKYASYSFSAPYLYDVSVDVNGVSAYDREETINLKGDLKGITGGLAVGVNFKLSNNIFLDWRIIGPGYGVSSGDVAGNTMLNADEQDGLKDQLASLKESLTDLPLKVNMDYDVNGNGTSIKLSNNPWATLRSGLSISYKF